MIQRYSEGGPVRFGLNWQRDDRTHIAVMLIWRGVTYGYSAGFRLRRRQFGSMFILRPLRRWRWRAEVLRVVR